MAWDAAVPGDSDKIRNAPAQIRGNWQGMIDGEVPHEAIQAVNATDPTEISGSAFLLAKTASGVTNWYFRCDDGATNAYQLTNIVSGNEATFGTNTTYTANNTGGYTFLPGGLILFYGTITLSSTDTVTFPFAYPSGNPPFSITLSLQRSSGTVSVKNSPAPSSTGFEVVSGSGATSGYKVYYMAIGN